MGAEIPSPKSLPRNRIVGPAISRVAIPLIAIGWIGSPAAAQQDRCLAVSDQVGSPFVELVRPERLGDRNGAVRFIPEARPIDVINCVRDERVRRVAWIVHASRSSPQSSAQLVYTRRLDGALYQAARDRMLRETPERIEELRLWLSLNPETDAPGAQRVVAELQRLRSLTRGLERSARFPLYEPPVPVLDRAFGEIVQATRARSTRLESFSMMTCEQTAVVASYLSLRVLFNLVPVSFAPAGRFASWWHGVDATSLDPNWIRLQLNL